MCALRHKSLRRAYHSSGGGLPRVVFLSVARCNNDLLYLQRKSGGLNLLEPSGPVQTCKGIALPLAYLQWRGRNKSEEERKNENKSRKRRQVTLTHFETCIKWGYINETPFLLCAYQEKLQDTPCSSSATASTHLSAYTSFIKIHFQTHVIKLSFHCVSHHFHNLQARLPLTSV